MDSASNKMKRKNDKQFKSEAQRKRNANKLKHKSFIGNKDEGQGFADKRKTKVQYEFKKLIRKEKQKLSTFSERTKAIYKEENVHDSKPAQRKHPNKVSKYHKEELVAKQKQNELEKIKKQKEAERRAKEEAMKTYISEKKKAHKKLAVKNYKGQPNMASQMELLLQKIEKQVGS